MLRPPISYMAECYPPYHQSYPPSHMDIDNETGAGAGTDNADNKTSTAASVARRPSPPPPPPQQTNYHYCPSLSGNDSSSINSNGCNYKYDDVIEVSGNNKNNNTNTNTNTNTNDFNIHQRLLEERKSDSNDNNDSNNAFLPNAMSSNFSSASSGNDSAPAAIKHPSTISETNKRRKLDSSNKNVTATAYDVTDIIAKKDGSVHNVRPVAVSYTQKRGNGGGGVLSSSTSTTANHRQKKRKFYTFEDQLAQLADYKEKNGHCIVPRSFQGYGNLGQWVSYQRQEYKKYKESKPSNMTNERICALEKLDFKWQAKSRHAPGTLSLLAQQENEDNEVVAVARSIPTLKVPPTEIVVDVEKEDQIGRENDDQLFGDNTMTSSNDGDSDEDIGEDNVYRAEGDDHYYGNSDHDGGGWHDLGDDFHDIDDDSLVFQLASQLAMEGTKARLMNAVGLC